MSARAGIVVTGTEVLTGRVSDRNGPWLSERLREARHRPRVHADRRRPPRGHGRGAALPRRARGRRRRHQRRPGTDRRRPHRRGRGRLRRAAPMVLDEALEERIAEILRPLMSRWPDLDPEAIRASNRKQAVVPEGATVLEPVGTAPGLVVRGRRRADDRRAARAAARAARHVARRRGHRGVPRGGRRARSSCARRCCGCSASPSRRSPRRCGSPRTATAWTALEITTCLRRGEIEVVTRFSPAAGAALRALRGRPSASATRDTLFSDDGRTVDQQVADAAARARPHHRHRRVVHRRAAGRPADRARRAPRTTCSAGSSSTPTRRRPRWRASIRPLIERVGAVSPEVAEALADGARARLGADVGVGITGVAGPGGGTEAKPVGLVCISVAAADARLTRQRQPPGRPGRRA